MYIFVCEPELRICRHVPNELQRPPEGNRYTDQCRVLPLIDMVKAPSYMQRVTRPNKIFLSMLHPHEKRAYPALARPSNPGAQTTLIQTQLR